jgi:hypothetical protein
VSDGLSEMTLAGTRRPKKQAVFVASDEGAGSEIEHQAAIHLAVEVEVEVIESFLSVSEGGLFFSSLQQSLTATSEFVGDETGEEVDRGHSFALSLVKAGFEYGGDTAQP